MSFVFVSGAGADSTEHGTTMWARVKGRAENALLAMPFRAVYVFRPAMIQPLDGISTKKASYRGIYGLVGPLLSVARRFWPNYISSTEELGKALLAAAKDGTEKRVIKSERRSLLLRSIFSARVISLCFPYVERAKPRLYRPAV
jgi:uncharacterized protein YbjT (DUF2867 family)